MQKSLEWKLGLCGIAMRRNNSMSRTKIPYDLIHELENKYGSIANVPEDNQTFASIRRILEFDWHSSALKVHLREDIKELLDKGYFIKEVADKLSVSNDTVRKSMRMFNMHTRPRFRYKVVKLKTGESIYGNVCLDFSKLINLNCSSYKQARQCLFLEGYMLTECNPRVLWGELKKGQKYYQNGQLKVKK